MRGRIKTRQDAAFARVESLESRRLLSIAWAPDLPVPEGPIAATASLPGAPQNLVALPLNGPSVLLNWTSFVLGVTGYRVYRQSPGGSPVQVAFLNATIGSYTDTAVAPLTPYVYQVVAEGSSGDGPASQVSVTTLDAPARVVHATATVDGNSSPSNFVRMGSAAFFIANDGVHGQQIWRTDGTPAGTLPLTTTLTSISTTSLTPCGSTLFFLAADASGPTGLWVSDGTPGRTARATTPNTNPAFISNMTAFKGELLYTASSGGIFMTDGTATGTTNVTNVDAVFQNFTVSGSLAYFTGNASGGGQSLWRTDGTPAGTFSVTVPNSGNTYRGLTDAGGTLYYSVANASSLLLYKSDGTAAGTVQLTAPGEISNVYGVVSMGGAVYFTATAPGENGQFWRTDGTSGGTTLVTNLSSSSTPLGGIVAVAGRVYFPLGSQAWQLWSSDGTAAGTQEVAPIGSSDPPTLQGTPANLQGFNGTLLFTEITPTGYISLWRSDGTANGTYQTGLVTPAGTSFVTLNNGLVLSSFSALTGWEPYVSDGSFAGTALLDDINTTSALTAATNPPSSLTDVNGTLYFAATLNNTSIAWKTDGTDAGTVPISGTVTSPFNFFNMGGMAYFMAPFGGNEGLWRTDGTDAGTALVRDTGIAEPLTSRGPTIGPVTVAGNRAYFTSTVDNTLWTTDGTAAGTIALMPLHGTFQGTHLGNELFFSAYTYNTGTHKDTVELWKSDGTIAGTSEIQVFTGMFNGTIQQTGLTAFNGAIYFRAAANNGALCTLWRTDGTAAGTTALDAVDSSHMAVVGNQLFFFGVNATNAVGLWTSDGTLGGTRLVTALTNSDSYITYYGDIAALGSVAIFVTATYRGASGLWVSDGTAVGTVPLRANADAYTLTPYDGSVFFRSTFNTTLNYTHGLPIDIGKLATFINSGPNSPQLVGSGGQMFLGTDQLMVAQVTAAPPVGLFATNVRASGATLNWTNVASEVHAPIGALAIERTTNPTSGVSIVAYLNPDATTFTDTTALPNIVYYYRIATVNAGGLFPDAFIHVTTPPLPKLLSTQVNDGSAQRSIVRSFTITFDHAVILAAGAITLARLNTGGSGLNNGFPPTDVSAGLSFSSPNGGFTWVVTFAGSAAADSYGSLNDGIYALTVHAALVTDAAGDAPGGGDPTFTFHRLFGDINGNGQVNALDAGYFRRAFASRVGDANFVAAFDFNNDGRINAMDWMQFTSRFGRGLVY